MPNTVITLITKNLWCRCTVALRQNFKICNLWTSQL